MPKHRPDPLLDRARNQHPGARGYGRSELVGEAGGVPLWLDPGQLPLEVEEFLRFREMWIAEQMRRIAEYSGQTGYSPEAHAGILNRGLAGEPAMQGMSPQDSSVQFLRKYLNQLRSQQEQKRGRGILSRLIG